MLFFLLHRHTTMEQYHASVTMMGHLASNVKNLVVSANADQMLLESAVKHVKLDILVFPTVGLVTVHQLLYVNQQQVNMN